MKEVEKNGINKRAFSQSNKGYKGFVSEQQKGVYGHFGSPQGKNGYIEN